MTSDSVPDKQRGSLGRVVLVGAGHAHLYSLRRASEFRRRGLELVVIAPEDFWYSGLATGVLAGIYPPSLDRIDIAALLDGTGARLIRRRISGLDLPNRQVVVDDGQRIRFGALSLNLGSAVPPLPGANERTFAAKPIAGLVTLRSILDEKFRCRPPAPVSVAIAGGGVTGCEIAASIAELARRRGATVDIVIYAAGSPLSELGSAGADKVLKNLQRNGIVVRSHIRVERIDGSRLRLADDGSARFDYLVNATGLVPAPSACSLGLPVTSAGALIVDDRLMSIGAEGVFAAGDCIAFRGQPLPRAGVYAIRQAPSCFTTRWRCSMDDL
jgi:NADH dehydrogenase FAD-containing subunit